MGGLPLRRAQKILYLYAGGRRKLVQVSEQSYSQEINLFSLYPE